MADFTLTRRFALSAVAGAGFAAVFGSKAHAYSPGRGLEIAKYDRPGDGSVNSYILIGPRSLAILDCQRTAVEARQVVAMARGLNLPVEAIVLSHEHPDHVVGLDIVASAFPDAPILASEPTRDFIERSGRDVLGIMTNFFGAVIPQRIPMPTRIIKPGERISLAGTEWVVDQIGPCEAAGMTMLFSEANNVLFAADLVGNRVTPWLADGHSTGWISELEKAKTRYGAVQTALPGHGAAAPLVALADEQISYLQFMHAQVRPLAANGTLSDSDRAAIRARVESRFPGYPKVAPPPNLIEMNADAVAKELAGLR